MDFELWVQAAITNQEWSAQRQVVFTALGAGA